MYERVSGGSGGFALIADNNLPKGKLHKIIKGAPMNYLSKIIAKAKELLDKIVYHKRYKAFQKWLTTQNLQSYAQYQQDLFAQYFFRGKRDLFFVDIGANDGISLSNTYLLENANWGGGAHRSR